VGPLQILRLLREVLVLISVKVLDLWNMDFNGGISGLRNGFGRVDASVAWFTPFNIDSPDVVMGTGGFSAGGFGFGAGVLAGGMVDR
jgi:hypothetical protein